MRDWIHTSDHIRAVEAILQRGQSGEIYNVSGGFKLSNLELCEKIISIMKVLGLIDKEKDISAFISYVTDRPGHDLCYSLSSEKLIRELGWNPTLDFDEGLKDTVEFITNGN